MKILFCALFSLGIASCSKKEPEQPPVAPKVYKENAYELLLNTKKLPDGRVVFQLNKKLYNSNAQLRHEVYYDTLPALGNEAAVLTDVDEDGNQVVTNKVAQKEYDVLFKVDTLKDWDFAAPDTSKKSPK